MFFEIFVRAAGVPVRETPESTHIRPAVRRTGRIECFRRLQGTAVECRGHIVRARRLRNPILSRGGHGSERQGSRERHYLDGKLVAHGEPP